MVLANHNYEPIKMGGQGGTGFYHFSDRSGLGEGS